MLHQSHSAISRPAFLVIIANDIFIIRIWVFSQISLDEISRLCFVESEHHIELVYVSAIQSNRVASFSVYILKTHELIWRGRGTSQLRCSLESKYQDVED